MRMNTVFVISGLLAASCCFGQTAPNAATAKSRTMNPGYTITVSPAADPIHLGTRINITITVKNTSGKENFWRSDSGDTAYKAFRFLLTQNGHECELTFFHRKVTGRNRPGDPAEVAAGSSIVAPVAPGQSFAFAIDLMRLYEITQPGTYKLDVSRFEEFSKTTVHAKPITFQVVP